MVSNLTQGIAPVLWGLMIEALTPLNTSWQGLKLNRYTVFFLAVEGVLLVALMLCRRLDEPTALNMESLRRDLFHLPARLWLRIWPRP